MKLKTTIGMILIASFALAIAAKADASTPEEKGFEIAARSDRSDLGFGDSEVELHTDPGNSELTTTVDYRRERMTGSARGEVRTGDGYVEAHGLDRIDFLKVDVEGSEDRVLTGFEKTLAQGRVAETAAPAGSLTFGASFELSAALRLDARPRLFP